MTQEKKPTNAISKRSSAKKASKPTAEAAPGQTLSVASVVAETRAKAKPRTKAKARAKSLQVSIEEVIRLRAYEIYLQRGATPGNPHEDWDVAEREVRAHYGVEAEA